MSTCRTPDVRSGHRREPAAGRPGGRPRRARRPGGAARAASSPPWSRSCGAGRAAWVGWAGEPGEAPEPVRPGRHVPARRSRCPRTRSSEYYEGFSNDTLWPIYHDVIVPATFHRELVEHLPDVNRRFAEAVAEVAAAARTVWVHDYQLQLVPAMVRELRPDVRIGWFNHIPFPPVELFAQLPWRRAAARGPARRRLPRLPAHRRRRELPARLPAAARAAPPRATPSRSPAHGSGAHERTVRASAIPISVDFRASSSSPAPRRSSRAAREIRAVARRPRVLMLGVDRLDYTKGIRHRLKAYEELLQDKAIAPPDVTLVQVATPEPRARRRLPRAARARSSARSAGSTASTAHRLDRRPLPAPLLPPRGDGGAVPGRRRHARDARCATA